MVQHTGSLPDKHTKPQLMEACRHFVSSRGLMKSCDYYSAMPVSSIQRMIGYPELPFTDGRTKTCPTVYICGSAVYDFCQRLLPFIDFPFILVSGDCDETCPFDLFPSHAELHRFLNHEHLRHWFCQNGVVTHPKISRIPIGLDYHTMAGWNSWGSVASPAEQENLLLEIRGRSPSFCDRYVRCYANFQFLTTTRYGADRVQALKQIPSELVDYEPCRLPRAKTWENQAGYAFVVSPHGNGLDCHRTWEALVLGCIPIVKSSRIDGLYEGLPVLIVDSWRSVSIELLRATIGDFKRLEFDYERLSLQYWVDRIRQTGLMCQKYL